MRAGARGDDPLHLPGGTGRNDSADLAQPAGQRPRSAACRRGHLIRFLALGDSYTHGEGIAADDSWPAQLTAALAGRGFHPELTSIAATGWTAAELLAAAEENVPRAPFDLVSLQVGVNDQYRGLSLEDYVRPLRRLLEGAVHWADRRPGRVIVLSIPDWTVTPHAADRDRQAEAAALEAFNRRLRDEAKQAGCRWVDVTDSSRGAAHGHRLLAADGLHPAAEMYREWVGLLLPVAVSALRGDGPAPG